MTRDRSDVNWGTVIRRDKSPTVTLIGLKKKLNTKKKNLHKHRLDVFLGICRLVETAMSALVEGCYYLHGSAL